MDNGHPNGVIQLVEIRELEALHGHSFKSTSIRNTDCCECPSLFGYSWIGRCITDSYS